jgi:multiple sugar transport system permease protein
MEAATAGRATTDRPAPKRAKLSDRSRAERRLGWWLCAPAVIVMLAVTAYPILYSIWLSLQRADLRFPDQREFIGLDNYGTVLSSSLWWSDFGRTMIILVFSVAIELVLGMLIALVMHRAIFGRGLVRTVTLIPYGIVTVVAAYAWLLAWSQPNGGFIPHIFGWTFDPVDSAHPVTSFIVVILAEVWKTTPFMALLLLAGLALVPDELHEAAKVDGATAWQRFWKITVPLMKPAILVALLFRTMDAFRIFDSAFIIGQNGTSPKIETVSILGYNQLLTRLNLGLGSAVSVLIFICVILIALVFIKGLGTNRPGET